MLRVAKKFKKIHGEEIFVVFNVLEFNKRIRVQIKRT